MKKVCTTLVLSLLAVSLLCGCGQRRREIMEQASNAKTRMAVMEQKIQDQQKQIDALEKELADLRKQ
jgi:septal ring factor EnvC (AmiA/AmiB activator)